MVHSGSWHWSWAGGIAYFHVSSPPEPCLSGGPWSHRHNRAVCTPNYLQERWQRPGNEQRDNKFPSKESSTPALDAAPSRALKGDGFSSATWKKTGMKMCLTALPLSCYRSHTVSPRKCHWVKGETWRPTAALSSVEVDRAFPHLGDLPKELWNVQAHTQDLIS